MDAQQLRGAVLRAWREYAGISAAELARRMDLKSRSAISNWESGSREHRDVDPIHVAKAMGMSRHETAAFEGMWRACGSVSAGMPRSRWAHNYASPSGPVWVWLRPLPGRQTVKAALWWGEPFQGSLDTNCGDQGLILTAPVSIPNPPIEVVFDGEGWADFGTGTIPDEVAASLEASLSDGRTLLGVRAPVDPPLRPVEQRALNRLFGRLRKVADDLGIAWSVLVPHLGMARSDRSPVALDGHTVGSATTAGPRHVDDHGLLTTQLMVTAQQARDLREARALSRDTAAQRITALDTQNAITANTVENLELSASLGRTPRLVSRLDTTYAADGRIGIERTFDSIEHTTTPVFEINFPKYWVGPIWVQATGSYPADRGVVDLVWGLWRRKQRVRSGMVLTTRRAELDSGPLKVEVPAGWRLVAGTGASPSALDVGRGWWPINIFAAGRLLTDNLALIRQEAAKRATTTTGPTRTQR